MPSVFTNADEVHTALRAKYEPPEWVYLAEVATGTGGRLERFMDGLAMNMWPSRGLALHGFEIKVTRSDWRTELRKPRKAEASFKHVDFWWLVVGNADIVKPDELPKGWGLLVPHGKTLKVKVQAVERKPKKLDRAFLASMLRSVTSGSATARAVQAAKADAYSRGYAQGQKDDRNTAKRDRDDDLRRAKRLIETTEQFQKLTGVSLDGYSVDVEQQAKVFNLMRQMFSGKYGNDPVSALRRIREKMAEKLTDVDAFLDELTALMELTT